MDGLCRRNVTQQYDFSGILEQGDEPGRRGPLFANKKLQRLSKLRRLLDVFVVLHTLRKNICQINVALIARRY
jgi:hypothetical protein